MQNNDPYHLHSFMGNPDFVQKNQHVGYKIEQHSSKQKQRSKSNSRRNLKIKNDSSNVRNRKYHRMSTFTPDVHAFINYLLHRGYDVTLKTFQQQMYEKQNSQHISGTAQQLNQQQLTVAKSRNNQMYMKAYLQQVKSNIINNHKNDDSGQWHWHQWMSQLKQMFNANISIEIHSQWIKLQFMLVVWKIAVQTSNCDEKEIPINKNNSKICKQSIQLLKSHIYKYGVSLSQQPQLLPYFALPYVNHPETHPFLKRIYSQQFNQEIISMLVQFSANYKQQQEQKHQQNEENKTASRNKHEHDDLIKNEKHRKTQQNSEWLSIVQDLIGICLCFNENRSRSDGSREKMLQRVYKYKKVIQNAKKQYQEQHEQQQINEQQPSIQPSQLSQLLYNKVKEQKPHKQTNINPKNDHKIIKQHMSSLKEPIVADRKLSKYQMNQFSPLNYEAIKQFLVQVINKNTNKFESSHEYRQVCIIFYMLNERLLKASQSQRRNIIAQYVQNDILLFNKYKSHLSNNNASNPKMNSVMFFSLMIQIQCLKLIGNMCFYSRGNMGCKYVEECEDFVKALCNYIIQHSDCFTNIKANSRIHHQQKNKNNMASLKNNNIVSKSSDNQHNLKINLRQNEVMNYDRKNIKQNQSINVGIQQRILQILGVLQKISLRKNCVKIMMSTDLLNSLVCKYLASTTMHNSNTLQSIPTNVLTYVLAILLNILLVGDNKFICSKIEVAHSYTPNNSSRIINKTLSFFELLVKIWQNFMKNHTQFYSSRSNTAHKNSQIASSSASSALQLQLQSFIYSIFYILMSVEKNKVIARDTLFIQKIQKLLQNKNQAYQQNIEDLKIKQIGNKLDEQQLEMKLQKQQQSLKYYQKVVAQILRAYRCTQNQSQYDKHKINSRSKQRPTTNYLQLQVQQSDKSEYQEEMSQLQDESQNQQQQSNSESCVKGYIWIGDKITHLQPQQQNIDYLLARHQTQNKKANKPSQPILKNKFDESGKIATSKTNKQEQQNTKINKMQKESQLPNNISISRFMVKAQKNQMQNISTQVKDRQQAVAIYKDKIMLQNKILESNAIKIGQQNTKSRNQGNSSNLHIKQKDAQNINDRSNTRQKVEQKHNPGVSGLFSSESGYNPSKYGSWKNLRLSSLNKA